MLSNRKLLKRREVNVQLAVCCQEAFLAPELSQRAFAADVDSRRSCGSVCLVSSQSVGCQAQVARLVQLPTVSLVCRSFCLLVPLFFFWGPLEAVLGMPSPPGYREAANPKRRCWAPERRCWGPTLRRKPLWKEILGGKPEKGDVGQTFKRRCWAVSDGKGIRINASYT